MIDLFGGSLRIAQPAAFALLAIAAAALVIDARRERNARSGLLFSSLGLLAPVRPSWRTRARWVLVPLRLLAIALFVVALARPQAGHAAAETPTDGIDIVLVIDVSSSMASGNFGGTSKMAAAKSVAQDFLRGLQNDRVGIVLFAAEALVLSPPTLDYAAPERLIAPIEAGRVLPDATAIGTGVATAINVLRGSEAKSRVVILLTDGEHNAGQIGPIDAAELARLLGIRVYTIGAVPAGVVGSRVSVDEGLLRRMAELTGGRYQRASDEETLLTTYRDIQTLEKTRVGARTRATQFDDVYLPFLALGSLLFLIELVLGTTILRRAP